MVGNNQEESGIYLEIEDLERIFEVYAGQAIFINDFDLRDEGQKEALIKRLYTEYDGSTLDTQPGCDCGELRGELNRGLRCKICGTVVATVTEKPLEPSLWMHVPEGVTSFISPRIWSIFEDTFKYRGIKLVHWLCDPSYVPERDTTRKVIQNDPLIKQFKDMGWKRSINHFIENFDNILDILLSSKVVTDEPRRRRMRQFIVENRHKLFPRFMPIPNRVVLITEKSPIGSSGLKYADPLILLSLDAVWTISSLNSGITPPTQRVKESRTVKAIDQLSQYYRQYISKNLGGKPGMFRKQVYGGRLDTSARGVITSICEPHEYDEVHMPWGMTILMMKTHIANKLLRRGMTPNEAEQFMMQHTLTYHPVLDAILKELIAESPYKGIPILLQRNPSLVRGSAQQLYVTRIKTDPKVRTISLSWLVLKAPNADFDSSSLSLPSEMMVEKLL